MKLSDQVELAIEKVMRDYRRTFLETGTEESVSEFELDESIINELVLQITKTEVKND